MKHWQDTASVLERLPGIDSGRRAALATVVRISGSAYRRPGAKLVVDDCGSTWGGVSGGCLEADVRELALEVIRSRTPSLRHYDTGSGDSKVWGLGLGCEGSVDVFIQPARSRKAALLRELGVAGGEPAQLFAPVGLDLGAEGPEQIAISIVAEALAVHAGRSPGHLRARSGGIHEP
jgi:xanthine/CO dehydrogenase XdhC/CoxF family maturation factor